MHSQSNINPADQPSCRVHHCEHFTRGTTNLCAEHDTAEIRAMKRPAVFSFQGRRIVLQSRPLTEPAPTKPARKTCAVIGCRTVTDGGDWCAEHNTAEIRAMERPRLYPYIEDLIVMPSSDTASGPIPCFGCAKPILPASPGHCFCSKVCESISKDVRAFHKRMRVRKGTAIPYERLFANDAKIAGVQLGPHLLDRWQSIVVDRLADGMLELHAHWAALAALIREERDKQRNGDAQPPAQPAATRPQVRKPRGYTTYFTPISTPCTLHELEPGDEAQLEDGTEVMVSWHSRLSTFCRCNGGDPDPLPHATLVISARRPKYVLSDGRGITGLSIGQSIDLELRGGH